MRIEKKEKVLCLVCKQQEITWVTSVRAHLEREGTWLVRVANLKETPQRVCQIKACTQRKEVPSDLSRMCGYSASISSHPRKREIWGVSLKIPQRHSQDIPLRRLRVI